MPGKRKIRDGLASRIWQSVALLFCVLFGMAMIANTQLAGEALWFWYATLFHQGVKLYADLHLPLQPLMVLETNAWMQMFGIKCLVTEIPAVLHVLAFSVGMLLILRESDWPDWQKAIMLASAFLISIDCGSYRFDDYHIVMDTFTFYSLALLLLLAKAGTARRELGLAAGLGILSGLAVTTRLNDGGALLVATGLCLLFLARERKVVVASLFLIAAAVTAVFVVRLTGDSFSDYATNSVFKAAAAKGGSGTIFAAPGWLLLASIYNLYRRWWLFLWVVPIITAGALAQRRWGYKLKYLVALQLGLAAVAYALSSRYYQQQLRSEVFFLFAANFLILANYLLVPVVASHYRAWKSGDSKREWDSREVLILLPLAELASFATSNSGTIATFFSPVALLLLLASVVHPFRRRATWAHASLITIVALMGVSAMTAKIHDPYAWLHFQSSPMFQNRQWYRHPVYGPMYIERDQLNFILPICAEIGAGDPQPELLSMPYSYPNYFCNTPPWHGYVQTFFDTASRSTIEHLMGELNAAPPQWIVYQRQMKILRQQELTYFKGQPMAHRELDSLIMQKIATGQWQVVEKSRYLYGDTADDEGDGWYVIRTRP